MLNIMIPILTIESWWGGGGLTSRLRRYSSSSSLRRRYLGSVVVGFFWSEVVCLNAARIQSSALGQGHRADKNI